MAYVPPALRRKRENALQAEKPDYAKSSPFKDTNRPIDRDLHVLKDIQKHFWPTWSAIPATAYKSSGLDHTTTNATQEDSKGESNPHNATEIVAKTSEAAAQAGSAKPGRSSTSNQSTTLDERNKGDPLPARKRDVGVKDGYDHAIVDEVKQSLEAAEATLSDTELELVESVHRHNTLNGTEESPNELQYVLLLKDANPRWQTDKIIYAKSALELLPTTHHENSAPSQDHSNEIIVRHVRVFEQQNNQKTLTTSMFKFIGYYNLIKMDILEPHSPALVRMQEQKWTRKDKYGRSRAIDREASGWKKSLSQRWAVLKFEKDEEATARVEPPQIQAFPDLTSGNSKPKKGVNEMLKELRMKDAN